ncbi:protein transport protein Sec24C-like isoform X3 [Acipenser ruthenus]|uniref:protein transport protein Sec24C-like isoform X3 n=1 Tax=Acipenser ruthenus TaxID=7906 RepID=UPI0027425EAA|nr:protein transport protein Sec24C-like isoform X3 [Acipenser ruthenus]
MHSVYAVVPLCLSPWLYSACTTVYMVCNVYYCALPSLCFITLCCAFTVGHFYKGRRKYQEWTDPCFSSPAQLPWRPSAVPPPPCPAGRSDSWAADPHSSLQRLPCTGADSPPGGSSDQDQASPKPNSGTESKYGLDPDLIPNVVQVLHDDEVLWGAQFFVTDTRGQLPPLSSTHCTVQDRGNASPRFLRCTSYSFPSSPQAALLSQLPLAAIVQPFARLARGEPPLPVSDPGLGGPVRCSSCGAHMNPFMDFQDCGQRFYCPFCASLSEVPWQYYTHTDRSGRRVDWLSRAELSRGSYEFLEPRSHGATQEPRCSAGRESARVLHREDGAPAFIFLIDVSVQAVQQGAVSLVCEELRTLLDKLPRDSGMDESELSVGVVTYDRTLHLYSLSPTLSRPHMLVVTETEDLELPLVEGLLVPVKDCRDIVDSLLAQIPSLFADTREAVVIFEPALQAGMQLLKDAGCPGKLLVFHTTPPAGDSRPGSRTDSGIFGAAKDKEPVGVASLGHASDISGGGVYMYSSLQEEADREQFRMDLWRNFQREIGFDAVMKIHVSKGLTVSGCFGPLSVGTGGPSELALGAIDSDKAFAVEFTHQGQLDPERGVVIQCALSYTAPSGQRRTRVHTLSLNCSCHLVDTFRNSQAETLLAFYCKKVYSAVLHSSPLSLRDALLSELTRTLASYRQHGSTSAVSAGQLVLPQFLKVLPVYLNCLRKSEVLLPGPHSALSDRVYQRSLAVAMDTAETAAHFYPRLLPLPVSGQPWSAVRCSQRSLAPDRVFLAEDGRGLFLWVGGCVPPQLVQSLFNVPSSRDLRCGACSLPVLDTPLSRSVRGTIQTLQEHRARHMKLFLVKQGDESEAVFRRLLVEDRSPNGGASYPDFLYHVHVSTLQLLT